MPSPPDEPLRKKAGPALRPGSKSRNIPNVHSLYRKTVGRASSIGMMFREPGGFCVAYTHPIPVKNAEIAPFPWTNPIKPVQTSSISGESMV